MDYYQIISTFFTLKISSSYRSHYFSVFPWKNDFVENILWQLQFLNIAVLLLVISFITTFPGCLSYYVEASLLVLADNVSRMQSSVDYEKIRRVINDYNNLHYITREVNKKLGLGVFLFYLIYAAQQTSQTYCIFRLIREGASLSDVQLFFTDIFVSL